MTHDPAVQVWAVVDDHSPLTMPRAQAEVHPPLVSVIVPAFNHAAYIEECLDSVLAGEYPDIELLVVDDGSTDDTAAVIRNWAALRHPHRFEFVSRPNRGLAKTLNELLHSAHGRYVAPLASDDRLLPRGITSLLTIIEQTGGRGAFGDAVVIDSHGDRLFESALFGYRHADRQLLKMDLSRALIMDWAVAGPVILYDREAALEIGGYSEDLRVEDWDFYLRFAARGWLRYLDEPVAEYRVHDFNEHRNPATLATRQRETRRIALRAACEFRGRNRLLLLRMAYAPVALGPLRTFRNALRSAWDRAGRDTRRRARH